MLTVCSDVIARVSGSVGHAFWDSRGGLRVTEKLGALRVSAFKYRGLKHDLYYFFVGVPYNYKSITRYFPQSPILIIKAPAFRFFSVQARGVGPGIRGPRDPCALHRRNACLNCT